MYEGEVRFSVYDEMEFLFWCVKGEINKVLFRVKSSVWDERGLELVVLWRWVFNNCC